MDINVLIANLDKIITALIALGSAVYAWRNKASTEKTVGQLQQSITDLEKKLRDCAENSALMHSFFENAADAIFIINSLGTIIKMNQEAEILSGYSRLALVGMGVDMLVPEALRDRHTFHRSAFAISPRSRPMGVNLPIHLLRKDGLEVPVTIALVPEVGAGGNVTIATVRRKL